MPNGKGALDCGYCQHFQSDSGFEGYDAAYEAGQCRFWKVRMATTEPSWRHRICIDFSPNSGYERDNTIGDNERWKTTQDSVRERFSWFGFELQQGLLYEFAYNQPEKAIVSARLDSRLQTDSE